MKWHRTTGDLVLHAVIAVVLCAIFEGNPFVLWALATAVSGFFDDGS